MPRHVSGDPGNRQQYHVIELIFDYVVDGKCFSNRSSTKATAYFEDSTYTKQYKDGSKHAILVPVDTSVARLHTAI